MLYIYLSDEEISVIEMGKSILGKESVSAVSRKQIPSGLIVDGLIKDASGLTTQLNELFTSAYPKVIKDKTAALIVSEKRIINQRLIVNLPENKEDFTKAVALEAKKVIFQEIESLTNFAKTINPAITKENIYFTAMPKSEVLQFAQFFKNLGIKFGFLTSKSLTTYQFLKPLFGQNENILYFDLGEENIEYYLFDEFGLLSFVEEKINSKSIESKIKMKIGQLSKEKGVTVAKIIVGGYKSLEFQTGELSETVKIPVQKIGEIFENILKSLKIDFDSGGIPQIFFIQPVALFLYGKTSSPANFAQDVKSFVQEEVTISSSKEELTPEQSQILPGEITEHKKFSFGRLFSKKIIVILFFLTFFAIAFSLFFFTMQGKKDFNFSFKATPTATPTPTAVPTVTPTPTIDPKLKRSDLKISVQNGTDKTGFAKETAEYLEKKGYKNVAKGNADKDTYEKTIIKIKKDKEKYLSLLVSDLTGKFDTSTVQTLEEKEDYDVILILGKK